MNNSCSSKCQRYWGFSTMVGLPMCERHPEKGIPPAVLNGLDKCPGFKSPYEEGQDVKQP